MFETHHAEAVLTSLPIGSHTGYVIAYFAASPDPDEPLLDDWAAKEHWRTDQRGDWVRAHRPEHTVDRDFDLAKWIASGHLKWGLPGDEDLLLHSSVEDCPYVGLVGRHERSYVQYGRVWASS
jgi:hypothetical protein